MGKSYTFTRNKMESLLIDTVEPFLKDNIKDMLKGLTNLDKWFDMPHWSNERLMSVFCDVVSDAWLKEHADIDDVLLQIDVMEIANNKTTPIKEWVCSRITPMKEWVCSR